nr:SDR family NAD(P)-dependent oxidoreductase [Candidatus Omnitrophota bacterium]
MRFKDKVAFITGGGRGIGRAIALGFAREGADIALGDINKTDTDKTCADIEAMGRRGLSIEMDVTNPG